MNDSRKVHEISDSDEDEPTASVQPSKRAKICQLSTNHSSASLYQRSSAGEPLLRAGEGLSSSPSNSSPRKSACSDANNSDSKSDLQRQFSRKTSAVTSPSADYSKNDLTDSRNGQGLVRSQPGLPTTMKNGLDKNVDYLRKQRLKLVERTQELDECFFDSVSGKTETRVVGSSSDIGTKHDLDDKGLPLCSYGYTCYRTGDDHVRCHSHPSRSRGFYLAKCDGLQNRFNADTFARSLKDVLAEDVGDTLESAVHFSYVYDMEWLIEQYPSKYRQLPMLLVVQESKDLLDLLTAQKQVYRNVFLQPVELSRFGTHHSKMISLKYKKHLRLVVTTANLYGPDWGRKSQMLWISPMLKKAEFPKKQCSDSKTGFRAALCTYLRSYQKKRLLELAESYTEYDFSSIKSCYFVGSTPNSINSGLVSVDSILTRNIGKLSSENPLTFCFSSIGTLGENDAAWLRSTLGRSLLANETTLQRAIDISEVNAGNVQAIYPTVEDVRCSLEGYEAGRSLPYSGKVHMKQRWLSQWLHRWKADRAGRTHASPHVKFYVRTSKDYQMTHWFLMSSANLSKAAWGSLRAKAPLSYECGILFIPDEPMPTDHVVLPFDLPPQRYATSDRLWIQDNVYSSVDNYGNTWDPRKGGTVSTI